MEQLGEYALVQLITSKGADFIVKMEHPPMEAKGEGLAFEAAPDRIHYFAAQTGLRSPAN